MDRTALDRVISMDENALLDDLSQRNVEYCGWGCVVTLMRLAEAFNAKNTVLLKYGTSADSPHGDSVRVVGYGSLAFVLPEGTTSFKAEENMVQNSTEYSLTREQKIYLLKLARETITEYVKTKKVLEPEKPSDSKLLQKAAVFVTLHKNGDLRGCIGQMVAQTPLYLAVRDMAISAAVNDHRFRPVTPSELTSIDLEVSFCLL
jgi:hypothetical protein